MRLVFFNRFYWPDQSATSQLLTDLATALARRGYTVEIVASRQLLDDPGAALPRHDRHEGVTVRRVKGSRFGRGRLLGRALDYATYLLGAMQFAATQLRRGDVAVAMTDPPLLGALLTPFLAWRGVTPIHWLQDLYPEVATRLAVLRGGSLLDRVLLAVRNRSLRRARLNVVIGGRMGDHVRRAAGPAARVAVIDNWSADLPWTPAPAAGNPYRRELGIGDGVLFCYSGNLGRAHRFDELLDAGAQLDADAGLRFLLIGGGAQFERVRLAATGLRGWSFLPYQPRARLHESLGAADVHLVTLEPALEGLIVPSKVFGILAAARPCVFIGDPDGEVARLLRRHDCGRVVAA
ncbi:MAG TPA: glycosyltransferase family 4 protein, partial [Candidatus Binatia bacterium]|nr:glycosyltransferase family 4 protein [Candidatus Binatia bacterium]